MLLHPDFCFHRIWDLTPEWLAQRGITALLLDVDNTLTVHGSQELPAETAAWLKRMDEGGVCLLILSNNSRERVQPFAQRLGLRFVARAAKPLTGGVRRALKAHGLKKSQLAVVGDQLFTDVLCANLAGVTSVLVEPMELEPFLFFKLKRRLERLVLSPGGGKKG